MKMNSVSQAPLPAFAFSAHSGFCPAAVTHIQETLIPDFHKIEVFLIDVSLNKILCPYAKAGRNGTVAHHRANIDSGPAEKEIIPNLQFVAAKIAFTGVIQVNFLPSGLT